MLLTLDSTLTSAQTSRFDSLFDVVYECELYFTPTLHSSVFIKGNSVGQRMLLTTVLPLLFLRNESLKKKIFNLHKQYTLTKTRHDFFLSD